MCSAPCPLAAHHETRNFYGRAVAAGKTMRLVATGELVLKAAANTQAQQSKNRSSSASVGVVMSTQRKGFGMTASGSRRRGHADGANMSVRSDDAHAPLAKIFDAQRVQKEINAQVQITQEFSRRANKMVADYVGTRRDELNNRLKAAENEENKRQLQATLTDLRRTEQALNILVGAVTGVAGAAVGKELLSSAAEQMRELMIEDSRKFKGITDGVTTLTNVSGESTGVRGDGVKLGGTRVDLDVLCGDNYERCATRFVDGERILILSDQGYVQFRPINEDMSLEQFLHTEDGKKLAGLTGGIQGSKGTLFGIPYAADGWVDQLIEAFAGTHDLIGGRLTGLYDGQGNIRQGMLNSHRNLHDRVADIAIIPSTPFALAELLPQPVWQAISIILMGAR